jgi:hypothetical protein
MAGPHDAEDHQALCRGKDSIATVVSVVSVEDPEMLPGAQVSAAVDPKGERAGLAREGAGEVFEGEADGEERARAEERAGESAAAVSQGEEG